MFEILEQTLEWFNQTGTNPLEASALETYGVRGDGLEPVVVQVEEDHLRLGGLQDEITELLYLETSLERQLQL